MTMPIVDISKPLVLAAYSKGGLVITTKESRRVPSIGTKVLTYGAALRFNSVPDVFFCYGTTTKRNNATYEVQLVSAYTVSTGMANVAF